MSGFSVCQSKRELCNNFVCGEKCHTEHSKNTTFFSGPNDTYDCLILRESSS